MKDKTVIELFKEQEKILNTVAEGLGFSLNIAINSNNIATLRIYKRGKKITNFEILTIEIKSKFQLIVKKGDNIITDILYSKNLMLFLYNYLNYEDIEFLYQFNRWKI